MLNNLNHNLTPELESIRKEVVSLAQKVGLSFPDIEFLLVSNEELNSIASYTGFPVRYHHWTFGMDYEHLKKGYDYGGSKIYELVINNDPVYAYLMKNNAVVDQKLVMAHVCGHADFFTNNFWFKHTDRKMMDQMASNASRIDRISEAVGQDKVEKFLDICLSINNLIDPYDTGIRPKINYEEDGYEEDTCQVGRLPAKDYMDKYINTKEFLEEQKKKLEKVSKQKKKFPESSVRDILAFLIEHSPAPRWQKDILGMIREEMYYFVPQMMTKTMNEGWASFLHSRLMTNHLATDAEIVDYCDSHSSVMSSGSAFNPYKIGMELFRDIEDRWNRGAFGKEYEECDDEEAKSKWDKKLGLGLEKVFQVRKIYNDITFIDEFLTAEFCAKNQLFVYQHVANTDEYVLATRKFDEIKKQFLLQLSNLGNPVISLEDANYQNRGELYLKHQHDGRDLDVEKARDTMQGLYTIWSRSIYLETVVDKKTHILWYDGKEHRSDPNSAVIEIDLGEDNGTP